MAFLNVSTAVIVRSTTTLMRLSSVVMRNSRVLGDSKAAVKWKIMRRGNALFGVLSIGSWPRGVFEQWIQTVIGSGTRFGVRIVGKRV